MLLDVFGVTRSHNDTLQFFSCCCYILSIPCCKVADKCTERLWALWMAAVDDGYSYLDDCILQFLC